MKQHRLLIATDIPFWRKSTGAEQRISSLVSYLTSESFVVRTFYLGQTELAFNDSDRQLIRESSLDVQQKASDQPPKSFAGKIGWYVDATINQFGKRKRTSQREPDPETESESSGPLRIEDFRWPWAFKAFAEEVKEFQPNSILLEYVKMGYLLESLSSQQRNAITCLIDTHDVLHLRCQQFRERGFPHWIEIDRDEESKVLNQFDVVVAVQPEEARLMQEMAPDSKVIICGHALGASLDDSEPEFEAKSNPNKTSLIVGYIGSTNWSNAQSIDNFLDSVWKPLTSDQNDGFELIVAGSIGEVVKSKLDQDETKLTNVRIPGRVKDLFEFYDQVDIVINPVEFGTGLKIKNAEALIMGKPVLTTSHGAIGLPESPAIAICDSSVAFQNEIRKFKAEPKLLSDCSAAARKLAKTAFSDQQVYSALKKCLLQGK